ncbi:MAG: hypothetical protein JO316_17205 [Abitibacteriaceae bacterium]|nr:hypothetical protein [Abditibacteriaceae bacterium]MBV9867095.1 hypothetical protein [Abditibacteriaceae bacterium]
MHSNNSWAGEGAGGGTHDTANTVDNRYGDTAGATGGSSASGGSAIAGGAGESSPTGSGNATDVAAADRAIREAGGGIGGEGDVDSVGAGAGGGAIDAVRSSDGGTNGDSPGVAADDDSGL